jgi:hypothetical protein
VLQVGNYVRGEAETRVWEHWADRIEGIAPYIQTKTVGVNPAPNLTWALMAHRDPETLQWSATPLIEPPPKDPLPISVPPWWSMKKKNAMFYTTIGRGDHAHFMLLASMLCIEDMDGLAAIDAYAPDIRAYITSLDAPRFPIQWTRLWRPVAHQPVARCILPAPAARRVSRRPSKGERPGPSRRDAGSGSLASSTASLPVPRVHQ